jgi:DNA modification methylase
MANLLYYGDNLEILREHVKTESIDLVYLDPPFNSNRSYNVLFGEHHEATDQAQIEAFDDTWTWTPETDRLYFDLLNGGTPARVADTLAAMHEMLGEGDVLAYLVMMTPRLVELQRVLKATGSLYLHCDPTASHYLKIIMDSVFEAENFVNEIVWKRSDAKGDAGQGAKHYGRVNDVLLLYSKSDERTWNPQYTPLDPGYVDRFYRYADADGRRYKLDNMTGPGGAAKGNPQYEVMGVTRYWRYSKATMRRLIDEGRVVQTKPGTVPMYKRYLDESKGTPLTTNWSDISFIRGWSKEKLGFPTQKPLKLLERIVSVSSNPGDVILDPFCGCGTAVVAAEELKRQWIGIDITYIAIDLMRRRLEGAFGSGVEFTIDGIPRDIPGAHALFDANPFDFERWAVSLVHGQPNEKQVGDKGFDGVIRFPLPGKGVLGKALVSVKGGQGIVRAYVQELAGALGEHRAEMGVLITLAKPTRGMTDAANHAGTYEWPVNGQSYPKVQIITIEELLDGKRVDMPPSLTPYLQAARNEPASQQLVMGEAAEPEPTKQDWTAPKEQEA